MYGPAPEWQTKIPISSTLGERRKRVLSANVISQQANTACLSPVSSPLSFLLLLLKMLPVLSKRIVAPRCARSVASSAIAPAAASRGIIGLRPLLHQCGAPRSLATASEAPRQSFKTPLLAIAGCLLGSAALVSASADEEKHEALYSPKQVQVSWPRL